MKEKIFKVSSLKKLISVILSLAMLFALMPMNIITAYAETEPNTTGTGKLSSSNTGVSSIISIKINGEDQKFRIISEKNGYTKLMSMFDIGVSKYWNTGNVQTIEFEDGVSTKYFDSNIDKLLENWYSDLKTGNIALYRAIRAEYIYQYDAEWSSNSEKNGYFTTWYDLSGKFTDETTSGTTQYILFSGQPSIETFTKSISGEYRHVYAPCIKDIFECYGTEKALGANNTNKIFFDKPTKVSDAVWLRDADSNPDRSNNAWAVFGSVGGIGTTSATDSLKVRAEFVADLNKVVYTDADGKVHIPVPEGKSLFYTGEEQCGLYGLNNYIIANENDYKKKDIGTYQVNVSPASGCVWSDGSEDEKTVDFSISYPYIGIDIDNSGNIDSINEKFRVLNSNGNVKTVLSMFDIGDPTNYNNGQSQDYNGSSIDTVLDSWYDDSLATNTKSSIRDTQISQYKLEWINDFPYPLYGYYTTWMNASANTNTQEYDSGDYYQWLVFSKTNQDVSAIETNGSVLDRKVFAPSVKDIFDLYGVNMALGAADVRSMFFGTAEYINKSAWLRDFDSNEERNKSLWTVVGSVGGIGTNEYYANNSIRAMFNIDLSNIYWTYCLDGFEYHYSIKKENVTNGNFEVSKGTNEVIEADKNDIITITPNPDTGYEVDKVYYKLADATSYTEITNNDGYKFAMPEGNVFVNVTFTPSFTIAKEDAQNGSFTVKAGTTEVTSAKKGTEITVTTSADSEYIVDKVSWKKSGDTKYSNIKLTGGEYKFTMPNENVSVKVTFKPIYSGIRHRTTQSYTVPVENGMQSTPVKAEIKDNIAVVGTISDSVIKDTVDKGNTETITIDVSGAEKSVQGTALDKQTLEKISEVLKDTSNKIENFEVKTPTVSIVLNGTALEAIASAADNETDLIKLVVEDTNKVMNGLSETQQVAITDSTVLETIDAYILAGSVRIHDLKGGTMTVGIEYPFDSSIDPSKVKLVHMLNNGGTEAIKWKTAISENTKLVVFDTKSLSYFVFTLTEGKENTAEKVTTKNSLTLKDGLKISQTGKSLNVSWNKVDAADGYIVYAAYCGNTLKKVKTLAKNDITSYKITKLNGKPLKLSKNYKVLVKAYKLVNGKKTAIDRSITAHIVGSKNTTNTNPKDIKLSKSSVSLKVGKTTTIKAKVVLDDPSKKQLGDGHAKKIRFASSNNKVATVDANGKITAKKKGECSIYVYAKNGYDKIVKVTVK